MCITKRSVYCNAAYNFVSISRCTQTPGPPDRVNVMCGAKISPAASVQSTSSLPRTLCTGALAIMWWPVKTLPKLYIHAVE
jgi:hypothetical protein